MAAQGRTSISSLNNLKFPTNNAKLIKAKNVRDFEDVINESKFNLVDDDLNDIVFDNSGTDIVATTAGDALIEVNNKISSGAILASGTIVIGNATSHAVATSFTTTGGFSNAVVAAVNMGNDSLYTVTLSPALATSSYMPIVAVLSNGADYDDDNDLLVSTFKSPGTSTFQIGLRKLAAVTTNITLYVKLMAM